MSLRCVYTDLDGTLLGAGASLFTDEDGNFSMAQARALEACSRAGVEVVIMSGRRYVQVHEDARIIGQTSFIFEAGSAFSIDRELTMMTGDFELDPERTVVEQMTDRGVPELLIGSFPGRLEFHEPWHLNREMSHLFRGEVDPEEANLILEQNGHGDLRLLDNGAIHRRMEGIEQAHCYHLVPSGVSKSRAVAAHAKARGYALEETIAVGDSVEDLEVAPSVGRFFIVANGPEKDPGVREAMGRYPNAQVTAERNGAGFYEAVVTSLMAA
ncbi:MAG: HAD family phosphatase [Solirubrobacterales bacterium]|nr:HAD family phosphatase [Solirubrobacterales bacterium]HMT04335.1 HAD hydrolase family protein [Solirubrobacterales bacterium]